MLPRLPTSKAIIYLYSPFYHTIKRFCFQANYPASSSNIIVFSVKRTVYENLMRSLAFICCNCYIVCDINGGALIGGMFIL